MSDHDNIDLADGLGEDDLVLIGVRDHGYTTEDGYEPEFPRYEVLIKLGGETHFDTRIEAEGAMKEYTSAMEEWVAGDRIRGQAERIAELEKMHEYERVRAEQGDELLADESPLVKGALDAQENAESELRQLRRDYATELRRFVAEHMAWTENDLKDVQQNANDEYPDTPAKGFEAMAELRMIQRKAYVAGRQHERQRYQAEASRLRAKVEELEKRPALAEPARCIVIPRPQQHASTLKIHKTQHSVKFCVPCGVYTTIAVCPCCGVTTLNSGRLPGEDAGVRHRREQEAVGLKPEHGSVSTDGEFIDVEAAERKGASELGGVMLGCQLEIGMQVNVWTERVGVADEKVWVTITKIGPDDGRLLITLDGNERGTEWTRYDLNEPVRWRPEKETTDG